MGNAPAILEAAIGDRWGSALLAVTVAMVVEGTVSSSRSGEEAR